MCSERVMQVSLFKSLKWPFIWSILYYLHIYCMIWSALSSQVESFILGACVPPDAVSVNASDPSNGSVSNRNPNKGDNDEEEGVKQAFVTLPSENTSSSQKSSVLQVFKKVPLYFPSQRIRNHHRLWFVLDVIITVACFHHHRHLSVSRSGLWPSLWRLCSQWLCQFFLRLRWMWKRCMEENGVRNTYSSIYIVVIMTAKSLKL